MRIAFRAASPCALSFGALVTASTNRRASGESPRFFTASRIFFTASSFCSGAT